MHTDALNEPARTMQPFRAKLKDEAKERKAAAAAGLAPTKSEVELAEWELTVGIEIHAQLNTTHKLFSRAPATLSDQPNTQVDYFDVAIPGSQPIFQTPTLVPAIRAALALNCEIQEESRFDRKHYFHWDQPAGYQITQYYQPFAKNGYIELTHSDGIAEENGDSVRIGIKQVQMEQDTAKTLAQPGGEHFLDFNRAGLPLIEIISLPQIHHPKTAAAFVRKVQILLNAVDACVLGMESGGLRADINVSVRRRSEAATHQYAGVTGLGQRTEIKNLSSFKAVEEAIRAERDRQIRVIQSGGTIEGETRGWTLGSTETKRLRGKEGEVDYRYMPDPDINPVLIGRDLVEHLQENLGVSPDEELKDLRDGYALTMKDAMTLVALNDRGRVEYFYSVVDQLEAKLKAHGVNVVYPLTRAKIRSTCGNWVLHELGGLIADAPEEANELGFDTYGNCLIPAEVLADIIFFLESKAITRQTAKLLLSAVFAEARAGRPVSVKELIDERNVWFQPLTAEEYEALAQSLMDEKVVREILTGKTGKIKWLVGQMMRQGADGRVDPIEAEKVIKRIIEERRNA